jgi:1-acyl-sn-glycerol-3-phosphate acyltransferase
MTPAARTGDFEGTGIVKSLLADFEDFANSGPALGRDPFDDLALPEPFEEHFERFELDFDSQHPRAARRRPKDPIPRAEPLRPPTARQVRAKNVRTPTLGEIELPDARGLIERLLGDHERRVLRALAELAPANTRYDRFGFSPEALELAFPLFYALHRYYFRVASLGHENIPTNGPAILCANHGGVLPFDGAMAVMDVMLHSDPPRLARSICDKWVGTLPFVNVFYARVGQVVGTRENVSDMLGEGQLMLCFPEGMDGVRKPWTQRYKLLNFRVGFVEQALRAGAPIVPMAVIGSDDQAPLLYDIAPLAKRLGLPIAPITPTFPWLGPLGLLPFPVRYRIVYGKPLHFHTRFGPADAEDVRVVRYLANQVKREVQRLIDELRS